MKLIKDTLIILLIEFLYSFFNFYIILCYKFHKKARSIVYAYWLNYDTNRFYNFIGFDFKSEELKYLYYQNNLVYAYKDRNLPICYVKDYEQYQNTKYKFFYKIKYIFYYCFIYMFLDDVDNINGVNKKILLNKKYFKFINRLKFNKLKIYKSIFTEEYWLEDSKLDFDTIKFFIKYTYTYNYLRDKAINIKPINGLVGYKYDYKVGKYIYTINKKILLRR